MSPGGTRWAGETRPRPAPRARPRRLGQHFLVDRNVASKIVRSAGVTAADLVVEIGPGRGILTDLLAEQAGEVIAIEIDPLLAEDLKKRFEGRENVRVVQADFLGWPIPEPGQGWGKAKFVANIPYRISSLILERLVRARERIATAVLMFQKEVATRILASPGTRDYSTLTVFLGLHAEIERVTDVNPACFRPRPQVFSTVLKLRFRDRLAVPVADERSFERVVHAAFTQRRKQLRNSLVAAGYARSAVEEAGEVSGISLERRGETLELEEFATLAASLHSDPRPLRS